MLFITSIWLFALAAVSIPVFIHLWNIKPGKTLKVGSIALFTAASPANSRSLKLLDILLLLVRCLLLVILAFLLAGPLFQTSKTTTSSKGWVLLSRNNLQETYQKFQPQIDSLINSGYELHWFEKGFQKADTSKIKDITVKNGIGINYWALIKQLEGRVSNVELYTPNTITHFKGGKPISTLKLNWHTYTPADSVSNWPARAWLMHDGDVRVLQGNSTPRGTTYQYKDIQNGRSDTYKVTVNNGAPYLSFKNSSIPIDTATERIAIYADKTTADVNYLTAALQAIQQLTGRNTSINIYRDANAIPKGLNWLYWLSDKPLGTSVNKTKNVFLYEAGKAVSFYSSISYREAHTLTQGEPQIALYKVIRSKKTGEDVVWADGFGNPVLSKQQGDSTTIYHFYSRFNPAWSDLVWSDELAKWLLSLTQPDIQETGVNDRRILSDTQIKPIQIDSDSTTVKSNNYTDISRYLWLALVILFITERWLATLNKTITTNG